MKPKVYVETTVLSYLAARPSKDVTTAGRQASTRRWWDAERSKYELVVSEAVEIECDRGDPEIPARSGDTGIGKSTDCSWCDSRKSWSRCRPHRGSFSGEMSFFADLEFSTYRECPDSQ